MIKIKIPFFAIYFQCRYFFWSTFHRSLRSLSFQRSHLLLTLNSSSVSNDTVNILQKINIYLNTKSLLFIADLSATDVYLSINNNSWSYIYTNISSVDKKNSHSTFWIGIIRSSGIISLIFRFLMTVYFFHFRRASLYNPHVISENVAIFLGAKFLWCAFSSKCRRIIEIWCVLWSCESYLSIGIRYNFRVKFVEMPLSWLVKTFEIWFHKSEKLWT